MKTRRELLIDELIKVSAESVLTSILLEIKEEHYTSASDVIGAINNRLDELKGGSDE